MTAPRKVVIVDDEEDVRVLVTRLLAEVGYDVRSAASGQEALEVIAESRPDVVVLDLMMPGMDGWEVLQRLQKDGVPARVVVLTARDDHDSFVRAVRDGATAYVVKPFRFHELIATVQRVIMQPDAVATASDRRRDPRRVLMAQVKIMSRVDAPIALGEILDVSASGLKIQLGVQVGVGDRVSVALHLPGGGPAPRLEGIVLWNEPAPRGFTHGLRLTDLSPDAERQLAALLAR